MKVVDICEYERMKVCLDDGIGRKIQFFLKWLKDLLTHTRPACVWDVVVLQADVLSSNVVVVAGRRGGVWFISWFS